MAAAHPDRWQARQRSFAEPDVPIDPARRWTSWETVVAFLMTAVGFGVYIAFASEQADAENAGEAVAAGVRIGADVGAFLLFAGVVGLVVWGGWQGWKEGRLLARLAGAIGLGALAMSAGFLVMLVVVHIVFG